ncbi:MAG: ECF-type sigma factor [Planctomycetota bacterium]
MGKAAHGDAHSLNQLYDRVYAELRAIAAHKMAAERDGHTLQPTALVHEAYLRLVDQSNEPKWSHRGHFYAAAAEAMRRILVESARRKRALKRGGDRERVALDPELIADTARHPDVLALDEALTKLAATRPELAKLVSLRYFAGLTMEQAANALGIPLRTAQRHWTYVRVWLLEELRRET